MSLSFFRLMLKFAKRGFGITHDFSHGFSALFHEDSFEVGLQTKKRLASWNTTFPSEPRCSFGQPPLFPYSLLWTEGAGAHSNFPRHLPARESEV